MEKITIGDVASAIKDYYQDSSGKNSDKAAEDRFAIILENMLKKYFSTGIEKLTLGVKKNQVSNFITAITSPRLASLYYVTEIYADSQYSKYLIQEAPVPL
jgi:hypothetical protein